MDSLLTAMPTIHTVLFGFFGALICGLAVYGVQKLQEAEDLFAQAKDEVVKVCSPDFFVEGAYEEFALNRTFDWNELIRLMTWMEGWRTKRLTGSVDDVKFGGWCERFMRFSTHAFLAYPFLGVVRGYTPSGVDRGVLVRSSDMETLNDMRRRMRELVEFKDKLEGTAIAIVQRNVKIKLDKVFSEDREMREEGLAPMRERLPQLSEVFDARRDMHENILKDHELRSQTDLNKVRHFFLTIDRLAQTVMPSLELALKVRDRWRSRFDLKNLVWFCVNILAVFLLGIVCPMLVVAVRADFNVCITLGWCWLWWYGYVLFGLSFVPYLLGAVFIIRKVKAILPPKT
ncbi:hypothetical protein [Pseudomonas sp. JQ36]